MQMKQKAKRMLCCNIENLKLIENLAQFRGHVHVTQNPLKRIRRTFIPL